jgi:protein-tyrosine-phosphatase
VPYTRIHFICTGNIYRSRLAEAYCLSRCDSGTYVFSSGIAAGLDGDAPITPYAAYLLNKYSLKSYAAAHWQPTTATLVQASDVLVFMETEHHRFCQDWIEPARQRIEVWGVEDLGIVAPAEIPARVEHTFSVIRERTDTLLTALRLSNAQPVS